MGRKITNSLRRVAKQLGLIEPGQRDIGSLPLDRWEQLFNALNQTHGRKGRRLSNEGAWIAARALLTGEPLSTTTFLCAHTYIGNKRMGLQGGTMSLTPGELQMFKRAEKLREQCTTAGVNLSWRLVIADWATMLFADEINEEHVTAYWNLMQRECTARGFEAIRWSSFMLEKHSNLYTTARAVVQELLDGPDGDQIIDWEAFRGEMGRDLPKEHCDRKRALAREHVLMRGAEGAVLSQVFGQQIVLSTESRSPRRYDNLVAPREDYNALDFMPYYPHRIDRFVV